MIKFEPREYQQRAIEFIKQTPKCALWLPMGAGKTACSLSIIKHRLDNKVDGSKRKATLIVAPKTVMITTWQNEIAKWVDFNHLTCEVLHGKDKEKTYLETDPDIFIINYEGLDWLKSYVLSVRRLKFNTIIFDESSKLKSWRTSRFKTCKQLCFWVERIVLLSATPTPKNYLDLWSQYFLLDKGQRLEKAVTRFQLLYFNQEGYQFKQHIIKPCGKDRILQKIADITFRIDEKELPELPALRENVINIKFNKQIQQKYEAFEKDMFYQLGNEVEGVEAITAASLVTKCRQFVQGFLYHVSDDMLNVKQTINIHNTKLEHLEGLLEAFNGEPVIIAYNFREDYHRLWNALKDKYNTAHMGFNSTSEEMKRYESQWNDKQLEVLLCNPQSVSHGLNLQKGGNQIIWYSLTYNWEHYTQLIGRLHRQGQENDVRNHILIAKGTIDEAVYQSLQKKEYSQKDFLKSLYEYQKAKVNKDSLL